MLNPRFKNIRIAALIMILFGIVELITEVYFVETYYFGGVYIAFIIGIDILFIFGGAFLATARRQAAALAMVCMFVEILARLFLIGSGQYPFNGQIVPGIAMVSAIMLAGALIFYIWTQWYNFIEEQLY